MTTNRKALNAGIIGCGLMGGIHADCYARERACRVAGVFNPSRAKAEDLAGKYGGRVHDRWESLVRDPGIDVVSICSPQAFHAEQAVAAAEAGKHILCEKPIALTTIEMDRVEAAVRKSGVTFMVAHQLRFHPVIRQVQASKKKLGRVFHLDLEWSLRIEGHTGRCWENYRLGGFFMELGCHMTDLAAFLMGPVQNVTGQTLRLNPKRVTEDHTQCLLKFESGAIGSILVGANHRTGRQGLMRGRVLGEKGRIDFTVYPYKRAFNAATLTIDKGKSVFVPDTTATKLTIDDPPSCFDVYAGFYDVYEQEIAAFLRAVRTGGTPPCTLSDGRSAVELVLATYHEQGRTSRERNFVNRPKRYRSDASSHPLLG